MKIRTKSVSLALAVIIGSLSWSSCKEEPKQPQGEDVKKIEYLDASAYDEWTYYSLRDNKVYKTVKYNEEGKLTEDLSNDKNWDIAFHRFDIHTQGGAFKSSIEDLSKAGEVTLGEFVQDTEAEITLFYGIGADGKHEMKTTKALINPLMSGGVGKKGGWVENQGTMPPNYVVLPNVWFVKDANGDVVALKFLECRTRDGKTGGITLNYMYLPKK